jgi:flagellar protein FliO/FliZ
MMSSIRTLAAVLATAMLAPLPAALAQGEAARAPTQGPPDFFSGGYLVQVLGSLLFVFACLVVLVYLLRRFNGVRAGSGSVLRVLGSASVGQREKVVLIDAGGEQILLGVAAGSVRTLHVFDEPVVAAGADVAAGQDFAAVLRAANPLGGSSR